MSYNAILNTRQSRKVPSKMRPFYNYANVECSLLALFDSPRLCLLLRFDLPTGLCASALVADRVECLGFRLLAGGFVDMTKLELASPFKISLICE